MDIIMVKLSYRETNRFINNSAPSKNRIVKIYLCKEWRKFKKIFYFNYKKNENKKNIAI